MTSAGWSVSWRGGPRQLADRSCALAYCALAAQVLVATDHVPPAFSQSAWVVYVENESDVSLEAPDGVLGPPVEGLAAGAEPVVAPLDGAELELSLDESLPPVAPTAPASAGARPMTATKSAKLTFFMDPPWGSNASSAG